MSAQIPTHELNDGARLPAIGFGTYPMRGAECVTAVRGALAAGYRLVDTAVNYGNEQEVGEAVRTSSVPRDEIFVTSKLPGRHHAYDVARTSVRESLDRLGLDYLDLHLIHWPNPSVDLYVEAWRALVELREEGADPLRGGLQLHRGPAGPDHRCDRRDPGGEPDRAASLLPAAPDAGGQRAPRHPHRVVEPAREAAGTVRRTAASPRPPRPTASPPGRSILRWQVQLGAVPIPKSATPERQRQNLDVFGFELSAAEMDAITGLGRPDGRLFGGDPETHEEM